MGYTMSEHATPAQVQDDYVIEYDDESVRGYEEDFC